MAVLYAAGLAATVMAITAADAHTPARLKAQAAKPAAAPVGPSAPYASPSAPEPAIAFETPVRGESVDSPFGLRRLPWEAHGRLHAGVDIAASSGAPVRASADGVVLQAGKSPSYGHFVEIAHAGGLRSFYAHMGAETPGLRRGTRLEMGHVIGFVGSTGRSTGAHLHFEIRKAGRPLNPALFIGRSFARLADLPIAMAGRYPRHVRVAYVSRWPESILRARADKAEGLQSVKLARAETAGPKIIRIGATRADAPTPIQPASEPIQGVVVKRMEGGRVSATVSVGN